MKYTIMNEIFVQKANMPCLTTLYEQVKPLIVECNNYAFSPRTHEQMDYLLTNSSLHCYTQLARIITNFGYEQLGQDFLYACIADYLEKNGCSNKDDQLGHALLMYVRISAVVTMNFDEHLHTITDFCLTFEGCVKYDAETIDMDY